MGISESRKKANNKYLTEKVEEFKVRVPKGEKQKIAEHGKLFDGSLNKFVLRAIDETMQRDNENAGE